MGNVASCVPSVISTGGVVKVFSSDGTMRIYTKEVKAAELMIENTGEFVCDAAHLNVGQRISALNAEEVLEPRRSYFLLPVEMLYSVLTNEEINYLNDRAASKSVLKHGSLLKLSKIFPVFVDFHCLFPESNKKLCFAANNDENEDDDEAGEDLDSSSRVRSWSWKPALETIIEVPTPPYA